MKTIIALTCDARRPLANGTVPLVVKLTKNNKRKYLRTGITLKPQHWDFIKNKPKTNCPNREYIEAIITEKLKEYQQQILEFKTIAKDYSLTTLVEKVEKPTKKITVEEYLKTIISNLTNESKIGNAEHYKALHNSLKQFSCVNILFSDIDISYLNKYEAYLRSKGNRGNTISIRMRTLRATYNKAIKENIVKADYYPFNNYSISRLKEETVKRAISKTDIQRIIDFDITTIPKHQHSLLQLGKDLFLFSYYGCGINMIDIAFLKKKNITNGRVIYKRYKTQKHISFTLQPHTMEIIDKYMQKDIDYIFPILDNRIHLTLQQKYRRVKKVTYVVNKSLKKIGNALNLSIPITSYVARHSFASVLKKSGVNIALISETLGHSDLKTTQIYLDSFDNEQIDEAMKNLL
ncbi:site-specific integrase [Dysgonomonas sp. Marseille-Q5470]|uniref:site-specific integrase n=1 Tax=Dysgonomonas sp. Marseille-Q5470 TaxID=3039494 RepID=UPI0024BCAC2A|nr:site-specific integrase [Dysgonomonas sp. Marseille-Q5470]